MHVYTVTLYNPTTDQFTFLVVVNEGSFFEAEKQADVELETWREHDHPDWQRIQRPNHVGGMTISPKLETGVYHGFTTLTAEQREG